MPTRRAEPTARPPRLMVLLAASAVLALPACNKHGEEHHGEEQKVITTSPLVKDVVLTQQYVSQIHSRKHIKVCALASGYIDEVNVNEGQAVKAGDVLFKIRPVLYKAKLDAERAEAKLAELELANTKRLQKDSVVSANEVALFEAKLAKANAKVKLAESELEFTNVRAKYDGIIDRLEQQLGSLVKEGEVLTTLSDNSVMWVYFNVPEARYLDYMTGGRERESQTIVLVLANNKKFPNNGRIAAIEAKFNSETGNIPFRADFKNTDDRLLRHGQTGTVLIKRTLKDALVIPQRATFEILEKQFVFVVDADGVAHQREIVIEHEMDDIYLVKSGVKPDERIVLEGIRQVRDGTKVDSEYRRPEEVFGHQKNHAE